MKKCISIVISILMIAVMAVSSSAYVMSQRYMTVYYGHTAQLCIDKNLTVDDVTFVSSDERIASVDENGLVTSNGIGSCSYACLTSSEKIYIRHLPATSS